MRKLATVIAIAVVSVATVWAQAQVATVTSSAPFTLRGATITPGQGVPAFPVMVGDTITAGNAPVIITFPDGSVLTLSPGSGAKVDRSGQTPQLELLSGCAHYSLRGLMSVKLEEGAKPVSPKSTMGDIQVGNGCRTVTSSAGWWTPVHTAIVLGGAGAAVGIGYGVSQAVNSGSQVSPTLP